MSSYLGLRGSAEGGKSAHHMAPEIVYARKKWTGQLFGE